jgi:hypothetical protein
VEDLANAQLCEQSQTTELRRNGASHAIGIDSTANNAMRQYKRNIENDLDRTDVAVAKDIRSCSEASQPFDCYRHIYKVLSIEY